ncbi:13942_t:CDS:2 [Rhizophagus irregularis]|nr:13942_t:CDS:2 [Rhizophagus irregularis]
MYVFVGCLAFAKIKKNKDNNYVALDGYLEHLDVSQVHPAAILKDNMKFIELNLRGNVLIDNKRFLLTSQDIINFRNSITKNALDIDIRNSVEKNIHQIFEVNDDELENMVIIALYTLMELLDFLIKSFIICAVEIYRYFTGENS